MEFVETDEKQKLQEWKDKVLRVKTICLDKMNKYALTNVSLMPTKEKNLLLDKVKEYMETLHDDEITNRFNSLVCNKILTETSDYTNYHVYDVKSD